MSDSEAGSYIDDVSGSDFSDQEVDLVVEEEDDLLEDIESDDELNKSIPKKTKSKTTPKKKSKATVKSQGSSSPGTAKKGTKRAGSSNTGNKRSKASRTSSDAASVASTISRSSKASNAKTPKAKSATKTDTISEKDAPPVIADYLNKQNRPYSAINIFDNLHGAIKKVAVTRVLDKLVDNNEIKGKVYGKSKLYYPDQEQYGDINEDDIRQLQTKVQEANSKAMQLKEQRKALDVQVSALRSTLTNDELNKVIPELQEEISRMKEKCEVLEKAAGDIGVNGRDKAIQSFKQYRKAWAERRRKVLDMIDNMSGHKGCKPGTLMEEIGIETDEEMGINLKEFVVPR